MSDPIADLTTALAGRYVIDRELGRGGMATVYLARDPKHDRFVALKTLRPEIALALGRERFLREIKLAARLQHPNILPVYDSGDANGTLYYVMPFVEGESLRERLDREPQLPMDDALQIAREVADALSYAHGHDVVHRDIKPENIMLSGGHAIVADFGIARAISAAGGDKLTETGLAIGTPAYMSPEQAEGKGLVDRRSDIYSLACVLYETLAGQPPFTGPTAQAIMARHSLDSVPRLKIVREAIPDALEDVIKRALAKVAADRYQTAAQFAEAIIAASAGPASRVTAPPRPARPGLWPRRWPAVAAAAAALVGGVAWVVFGGGGAGSAAGGGGLDPQRVAVLYFADLSPDSSLGYLADALTEALIDQLSPVRSLDVISRNGVAPFRRGDLPRDSIARTLQAGTLVEGSVEPAGQRLRVTVRLVDGASGADFRRESFELPAGDVLAIRDSLARQAALILRERLGEEVRVREQRASTRSVEAWVLVQQAERARKDAENLLGADQPVAALARFTAADSLLATAERADDRWVEPILARGRIAYRLARLSLRQPTEAQAYVASGIGHAERALRAVPNDPAALELRGTLLYTRWLFLRPTEPGQASALLESAQRDLEQAVGLDPRLASAFSTLSHLRYQSKDVVGAVLAARRAYEEDAYLAVAPDILWRLFLGSYDLAQFAQAGRWCDEGYRRFPRNFRFTECQLWMMTASGSEADVERAWQLLGQLGPLLPSAQRDYQTRRAQVAVAAVIGRARLADSADRVFERARPSTELDPSQSLLCLEAAMRAVLRQRERALALVRQCVAANPEHEFRSGGDVHWWWQELRNDPGFRSVIGTSR